jgi:hypothetical protein
MISGPSRRSGATGAVAGLIALGALVASGGCDSSAPASASGAQAKLPYLPAPSGSLPEVTVALTPTTRANAELTGYAWYLTSVKDPARGSYTAAVERRSLTRLWFDVPDDGEQRASIALVLRDGQPADLILSIERGHFVCADQGRENVCALRVSIDDAAARPVRFTAPRHRPATYLHLAGGDDARRLLAAIAKAKRLRIQPTFREEGSPEIEFALTGLNPVIARLAKRSVAAMPTAATADPGA